jgi:hypothetical protein
MHISSHWSVCSVVNTFQNIWNSLKWWRTWYLAFGFEFAKNSRLLSCIRMLHGLSIWMLNCSRIKFSSDFLLLTSFPWASLSFHVVPPSREIRRSTMILGPYKSGLKASGPLFLNFIEIVAWLWQKKTGQRKKMILYFVNNETKEKKENKVLIIIWWDDCVIVLFVMFDEIGDFTATLCETCFCTQTNSYRNKYSTFTTFQTKDKNELIDCCFLFRACCYVLPLTPTMKFTLGPNVSSKWLKERKKFKICLSLFPNKKKELSFIDLIQFVKLRTHDT